MRFRDRCVDPKDCYRLFKGEQLQYIILQKCAATLHNTCLLYSQVSIQEFLFSGEAQARVCIAQNVSAGRGGGRKF